ncbi:unnamed protein product [Euphydryas editha]|uniref:Uncharacterized protein n=1 Tax=Euphydryas editha TaxID=104508 RepID=A0AAU9UR07_EUPED|nr:unnamed protein product [Euphydryas editha]
MKTVLILKPTEPTPEKSQLIPIPESNIFDIIQPSMEPNYFSQPVVSQTHELEYKPTVELEYKPAEPEYKSTATTNPEKKSTEIKYSPEPYPKTSETTYSPISEKPTLPIVVTISTTEETATKKGHKNEEGSVLFDTSKFLKINGQ